MQNESSFSVFQFFPIFRCTVNDTRSWLKLEYKFTEVEREHYAMCSESFKIKMFRKMANPKATIKLNHFFHEVVVVVIPKNRHYDNSYFWTLSISSIFTSGRFHSHIYVVRWSKSGNRQVLLTLDGFIRTSCH